MSIKIIKANPNSIPVFPDLETVCIHVVLIEATVNWIDLYQTSGYIMPKLESNPKRNTTPTSLFLS